MKLLAPEIAGIGPEAIDINLQLPFVVANAISSAVDLDEGLLHADLAGMACYESPPSEPFSRLNKSRGVHRV